MIESRKINIIIVISLVFAVAITILLIMVGNMQEISIVNKSEAEYTTKIFGEDIISIEIIADKEDWQQMLDNAINEQYIIADVIVNGTKFQSVGIRPKGNSSLTQVANSDSDRYSFRLQFNEYIKGQTCFGLESFVVNNMLGDNTYMKEYVSYDLMQEIGVDAPYFGFADIKVNGENWGLYLAVELYNESYEQRVFNDTSGMLYNVKSMEMGENKGENLAFVQSEGEDKISENRFEGKVGSNSRGGSLEYTDDEIESYSSIFNNVIGKGTEKDFKRIIQALKMLSEENELEKYFDVDKILRYLAAHTIVVNLDSYSSNMAQNYYIYENDGKITILPWDYNLAWGGFQSGNASSVINFPIDTPLSGVEMSSRPLIEKLFANTEYLKQYHNYLQQLIDEYFANGKFEEKINTLDALISDYVKNDKTSFCTYEEYKKAILSFITLGNLRAESVKGQLDGAIPSTTKAQSENSINLISEGDLDLSDLGSMMGGKGGNNGDFPNRRYGQDINMFSRDLMIKAMDIIRQKNGDITDDVKDTLISLGLTMEQVEQILTMPSERLGDMGENGGRTPFDNENEMNQQREIRNPSNSKEFNANSGQKVIENNLIQISLLLLILIIALIFVARYKKSY